MAPYGAPIDMAPYGEPIDMAPSDQQQMAPIAVSPDDIIVEAPQQQEVN